MTPAILLSGARKSLGWSSAGEPRTGEEACIFQAALVISSRNRTLFFNPGYALAPLLGALLLFAAAPAAEFVAE